MATDVGHLETGIVSSVRTDFNFTAIGRTIHRPAWPLTFGTFLLEHRLEIGRASWVVLIP
jgi:hypothetical protein